MVINKALVIAAHPDDETLGCGGVISKLYQQGKSVRVIFIAEGTSCRFDAVSANIQPEIDFRNNCAVEALSVLGVNDYQFYNLPCGRLDQEPIIDIAKIIEKEIKNYLPDTIFTHHHNDLHVDHRTCALATIQATRPTTHIVKNLFAFEILSSSDWKFLDAFTPNVFFDISDTMALKLKAMNKYSTEQPMPPHPRSDINIKGLGTFRGGQSGSIYAEAFELIRGFY